MKNENQPLHEVSNLLFNIKVKKRLWTADNLIFHYQAISVTAGIWTFALLLLLFFPRPDFASRFIAGFIITVIICILFTLILFSHDRLRKKMLKQHTVEYDDDVKNNIFNLRYFIHLHIVKELLGDHMHNKIVLDYYLDDYETKINQLGGTIAEIKITHYLNIKIALSMLFYGSQIRRYRRGANIMKKLIKDLEINESKG